MAEPLTIDNLGIEPSIRWAQDQEYLNQSLVKESPFISQQATIDVFAPFSRSELNFLFQTERRHLSWSSFAAPKGFLGQRKRLFTAQLFASLGSDELQQARIEKIRQYTKQSSDSQEHKDRKNRESATLLALLEYLQTMDRELKAINARRSQYSKG